MTKEKQPEKETDDQRFNDTLKRMLKTPPEPHGKPGESKTSLEQKPDGAPGKKRPPGGQ